MSICVEVINGAVVESLDTFPQCGQFALVTPSHLERLTYWADLSIALDPSGTDLYSLMGATLLVYVAAWGWKTVARQIFNR